MNISFSEMSPKEQKLVIEEVTASIIAIKALMIGDYKKYEKYSNKSLEYYKKLSNYLKVEKWRKINKIPLVIKKDKYG